MTNNAASQPISSVQEANALLECLGFSAMGEDHYEVVGEGFEFNFNEVPDLGCEQYRNKRAIYIDGIPEGWKIIKQHSYEEPTMYDLDDEAEDEGQAFKQTLFKTPTGYLEITLQEDCNDGEGFVYAMSWQAGKPDMRSWGKGY